MMNMMVQLRLGGCRVLVAGAGPAAALKLKALKRAGATPLVVAPMISPAVERLLAGWAGAQCVRRPVRAADLAGCWLAIAATGDTKTDQALARQAEQRRIPCLVAGDAKAGRLGFVAQARAGALRVAVATGGMDPHLAVRLARETVAQFKAQGVPKLLSQRHRRG